MDIYIDGKALDATIEQEETVGDLFVSLEQWLSGAGFRSSAVKIDGKKIHAAGLEAAFAARLQDIARLDIETMSVTQLYAETLLDASFFLRKGQGAETGRQNWRESAGRSFLVEHYPEFAQRMDDYVLEGKGDSAKLNEEIAGRLREITDPEDSLLSMKEKVYDVTSRLEMLALDMQMGKDKEATETVRAFSDIAEKIFRILSLLPPAVYAEHGTFFEEFTGVLREFLAAYRARDSVLTGDLAEYEVSPRLIELYDRLKEEIGGDTPQPAAGTAAKVV
jgi:hypothetical protein